MENNEEKRYWGSKFFGSKLNTVLLLILIVLMVFAIFIIFKDKETYFPVLGQNNSNEDVKGYENNISSDIPVAQEYSAIYEDDFFSFKYNPKFELVELPNNQVDPICECIPYYKIIGLGYKNQDGSYEIDIKYGAGEIWIDEDPALKPVNIKVEQRQTFGVNVFAINFNTSTEKRTFQMLRDGYKILITLSGEKNIFDYIDMSSIVLKNKFYE